MQSRIFLLLGSNLGDRLKNLLDATTRVEGVVEVSAVYATAAWGITDQPDFLNQVIRLETNLEPATLLYHLLDIENKMGRIRSEKWGPRTIDIDILFYNNQIMDTPRLTIPHPELQNRKFALAPLCEIAPDFVHPVLNKSIRQLYDECADPLEVKRLPPPH